MDELITPREVAEMLKVHPATLARWRADGSGPAWIEIVGQCRYRRSEVESWLEQKTRSNGAADG